MNHLVPKNEDSSSLRLLDFTQGPVMKDAVDLLKHKFGDEAKIFGVGFSLGGNHILRSVGAPIEIDGKVVDEHQEGPGFEAIATVS